MKIEHTTNPNSTDIDFLTEQINLETPQFGNAYPFAFFIKNDKGKIIAGANGSIVFAVIYTDQLWVSINYRKTGLGKELMEEVHKYGKDNGYAFATVS